MFAILHIFFFKLRQFLYIAQAGLKLLTLHQPLECFNYRCAATMGRIWVPRVFQQEPRTPSSSRHHLKCLNSATFDSQFSPPVEAPDAQVRELITARLGSKASLLSWLSLWSEASISTNKCGQIMGGGKAVHTRVQMNANVLLPASVCTYVRNRKNNRLVHFFM